MPRTDLKSILVIGAGPIIIGQACEFDYSGTQACKALREDGYRVILINSNPATIMTDPELADATYIEPITPEIVARIIEREKPDAILPTMGGQTALNITMQLAKTGVLEAHQVQLIGANLEAINRAEDRQMFRQAMDEIGLESPRSERAHTLSEAEKILKTIGGLPVIIRPSFTMGGTGGGIAYDIDTFRTIVASGLDASPISEVLVEESVLGWKEYEMEVVRDRNDNCIIICSIENIDPMGIHTGDSITVAPALTLSDREYQIMRNASIAVLRKIGVETGGSNVQFAINPVDGRMVVIEMNPRVSRSSALASKATGFPIAKIAAKLAVGYTLDELTNDITRTTPASFEPTIDYVVTKIPRFAFEKFPGARPILGTSMKSVGETMAIGGNFAESLQKALRSLETGLTGLNTPSNVPIELDDLRVALREQTPMRILLIAEAIRRGITADEIMTCTHFDPWFIEQITMLVQVESEISARGLPDHAEGLRMLKQLGFSDARLAELTNRSEVDVRTQRHAQNIRPYFRQIDTCAAEFEASTPYLYSSYAVPLVGMSQDEAPPSGRKKAMILGGGPNRIGQGIEFDYCCCHAAYALADMKIESIMVNCNPETVSTDYDTSDRLYFEPLTEEDVFEIIAREQQNGVFSGVIVQFGGQTPLKLAEALGENNIPILGTSPDAIDLAEDRDRFKSLIDMIGLKQPPNGIARSPAEAEQIAHEIGFPLVIRPSYVLGGRAMEIVYNVDELARYIREAVVVSGDSPVLIDHYLRDAIELDVDVLADGETGFVAGILQHIEQAGVHSGDSACSMPPYTLADHLVETIGTQAIELARALNVIGLMNVQFAVQNEIIYVLEVNPRASRTVPFVAKVSGYPIANIAAQLMAGAKLASFKLTPPQYRHVAVKEAVFPFARFSHVDTLLGPEMRSTGEVMGIDTNFARAFGKSQLAAGCILPASAPHKNDTNHTAFISVRDNDKKDAVTLAQMLDTLDFSLLATHGTADVIAAANLNVTSINKVREGSPHIVDALETKKIAIVINTTEGAQAISDSKSIRRTALMHKIPYYTTIAGAHAGIRAIAAMRKAPFDVRSIQSYMAHTTNNTITTT